MRNYELTYLISPDFSEEELKNLENKIASFIQEEVGVLNQAAPFSKKRLYSPIKKKTLAFLSTLSFNFAQEKLAILEKKLKSEGQILRYLILAKPVVKEAAFPVKKLPKIKKPAEKKVELKEIEKKLEEILGET